MCLSDFAGTLVPVPKSTKSIGTLISSFVKMCVCEGGGGGGGGGGLVHEPSAFLKCPHRTEHTDIQTYEQTDRNTHTRTHTDDDLD